MSQFYKFLSAGPGGKIEKQAGAIEKQANKQLEGERRLQTAVKT